MRLLPAALAAVMALTMLAAPANARQNLRELVEQRREARAASALPPGARIERDIAYGPHPKQRYDVYLPAKAEPNAPILLMVHGGGWRRGDKDNPGVADGKAAHWLAKGFVFVNVNNRLLPDADPLQQARDVAMAVASVQRHAPHWGAAPDRVVLMGHSAGAHLVALLGSSPDLLAATGAARPLGVVALDSAAMNVPELMRKPRLPALYHDAFGTDRTFWASASPFHRLSRQALPMLLVCSSRRLDSCPQGRALAEKAKDLGVPMQVLPEDLSHGEINHALGKPSAYTRAVSDWIDRLLN